MSRTVLPPDEETKEMTVEVKDLRLSGAALPEDGSARRRIWRCLYPFFLDLVLTAALSALIGLVIGAVLSMMDIRPDPGYMMRQAVLMTGITDALMIPVFLFLFLKDERKRRETGTSAFRIPVRLPFRVRRAAAVALSAVLISGAVELVVSVIVVHDAQYDEIAEMISSPGLLSQFVVVGVIGPIMEELLFRGVIYRRMRDYVGVMWAVILSGILFGVAHGNLTQGLFAGLLGMLLALYYEHYGSLWAPCAAHMANNIFSVLSVAFLKDLPGICWLSWYLAGGVLLIAAVLKLSKPGGTVNAV